MSWKEILKNESREPRKYSEKAFDEIVKLLDELTGEKWNELFGNGWDGEKHLTHEEKEKKYGENYWETSKTAQLIDEYYGKSIHGLWNEDWVDGDDFYTEHFLKWLKENGKNIVAQLK